MKTFLYPDGTQEKILARMVLRLRLTQLTAGDQLLHIGVIPRDLAKSAV